MRILDRYIVREVFRHALLGLLVFTFVFIVTQLIRLMEVFVRHSGSGGQIVTLLLCIFPPVLTFTVPMAVLVGVLLGLGRMSADSELIALTALGVGLRRILLPVGVLAAAGALLTLSMTLWLGPLALHTLRATESRLLASQSSFQLAPRVFEERIPRLVLYVNDVAASGTQWRGVFLADTGGGAGSRITLAKEAIVIVEPGGGKVELHLRGGTTHEYNSQDPDRYSVTDFGDSDWPLEIAELAPAAAGEVSNPERPISELLRENGRGWREAHVEYQRRLAFPMACFAFALIAVPLGARPRRGGRATAFLLAMALIAGYYLLLVFGTNLAREGSVLPVVGAWMANALLLAVGLFMLPRMEQFRGENDLYQRLARMGRRISIRSRRAFKRRSDAAARSSAGAENGSSAYASSIPQLMDLYVLRSLLFYFGLLVVVFLFLFEIFTFFELLDNIAARRVPFVVVVKYFYYLTPYLFYQLAPLGGLMAVLVTLGVMSKNNEVVACKANGISLYRLAMPLLAFGLALAAGMLLLDDTYLPYASQQQDALHNQIKGKPAQTYAHPRREWIFGDNSKIYNYGLFDPDRKLFGGLTVLELDPATFQVRRRVYAERAHWEENSQTWKLESGWVRDFSGGTISRFEKFASTELPELSEPPSYFDREVRQAFQMSWRELGSYIEDLHQAGFDVSTLTVQWHEKIAFPMIAPVSMLLAIPFALLVGTRGAVGGVALGVGFGIVYWTAAKLLEAMGGVGQLPPFLAGWSPDMIFLFFGLYFFFKMPT